MPPTTPRSTRLLEKMLEKKNPRDKIGHLLRARSMYSFLPKRKRHIYYSAPSTLAFFFLMKARKQKMGGKERHNAYSIGASLARPGQIVGTPLVFFPPLPPLSATSKENPGGGILLDRVPRAHLRPRRSANILNQAADRRSRPFVSVSHAWQATIRPGAVSPAGINEKHFFVKRKGDPKDAIGHPFVVCAGGAPPTAVHTTKGNTSARRTTRATKRTKRTKRAIASTATKTKKRSYRQ